MLRLARLIGAFLLIGLAAPAAWAEERITRYVSDVRIRPDSVLEVTETIDVEAEQVQIKRGIFRDFPTSYRRPDGAMYRVGFTVRSVTRNGSPEPFRLEPMRNGVRVRIGDDQRLIDRGEHRYVIQYETSRQVGRFPSYDELYWNAVGTGWDFPVDVAQARIRLPSPVSFGQRAAYTGPQGASGRDARVVDEKPGEILFETSRRLAPREGFTVAVAFPKGVVGEPAEGDRVRALLSDYGPYAIGLAGLLLLAGFYFIAWKRAGRDPRPGTVVPLFSPPDGLSPAAMRYIWKMKADNRAFAAALVELGVKGHVRLVEEDGGFFSGDKTRIERLAGEQAIGDAEQAMVRELASTGESIVMEQKNHAKFAAAKKGLAEALKRQFEGRMFNRNWGWAIAGLILFFGVLWSISASVLAATGSPSLLPILVTIGALVTAGLLAALLQEFGTTGKCLLVLGLFLSSALALSTGMPIFFAGIEMGWWQPFVPALLALPLVASAFWWIAAPTREGRAMLDRIMGFRHYLSIAEGQRLERMTPPEETPELFEKYLPHAIALGVENRWAERFEGTLAAASVEQRDRFRWYSGSRDPWHNPGRFVGAVGSSLASSVSAASTAPGSRSGSSGGGSSGGGGGGGGGGGW